MKSDLGTALNPQQPDFLEASHPLQAQLDGQSAGSGVLSSEEVVSSNSPVNPKSQGTSLRLASSSPRQRNQRVWEKA